MKFFVMDQTGHSTLEFDAETVDGKSEAMTKFMELVGEKKHTPATRQLGQSDYTVIKQFNQTQDETVFVPAMQGG